MRKVLKFLVLVVMYLVAVCVLIICSPALIAYFLYQQISKPFEKKKFLSSGFERYHDYNFGITNSVTYKIYLTLKSNPFELIANAFANIDVYVLESETKIIFFLADDFEESIHYSTEENDWICYNDHFEYKNVDGQEVQVILPFKEMEKLKDKYFPNSAKSVEYFICLAKKIKRRHMTKGDSKELMLDSRLISLSDLFEIVSRHQKNTENFDQTNEV